MELDLELYRRDVFIPESPPVRLSIIDIAPEKPEHTLLFLHGFGGQTTQWQYQLEAFSSVNRVLGLDLRGHGHSDTPPGDYSIPKIINDISTALDEVGVDGNIILVGHSFGGALAAEFSIAYPDRVSRLILVAVPVEYKLNWLYRTALSLPVSILRLAGPFTRGWLGAPPTILQALYRDSMADWDGSVRFKAVSHPTLVIRGDRDRVFSRPSFEDVVRTIPGVEDLNVGASGHMVMLERRKAVDRAIQRFLGDRSTSWRDEGSGTSAAASEGVLQSRPWIDRYDDGVPPTISIPPVPMHFLLESTARRFPTTAAILFEGGRISYGQLLRASGNLAASLHALGLRQGDRIVLLLPNVPEFVLSYFAALKLGAVAVFTLPTTDEAELIRQIGETGAKAIITLDQFAAGAYKARETTDLELIITTDGGEFLPWLKRLAYRSKRGSRAASHATADQPSNQSYRFGELIQRQRGDFPGADAKPEDLAVIIYTGGTTASPRGVMLSHRNLVANALQARHWMPESVEGEERFLCVVPFTHSYGMTAALNVPITIGASLILKPKFEVEDVLKTIRRYQPTIFPGVPNMYVAIKDFPAVRKYKIESIKACLSGAAPLPVEVQESFEKLTRGRLVEAYGLTEASPATHSNPLNGLRKEGTIGIPLPSTEAQVVDLKRGTKVMPVGQIGELAVRGPQVMMGYWEDPKETGKVINRDGWLLTGDVVQMDQDGYFRLIARKADMWYPGNPVTPAFPRDVEEVIYEIPQVKEAAVIAVANRPIAFVISQKPAPTAKSVIAYCKRRLPPELVPRLVIFVDEFPRTFIGKVLRRELRARYDQKQQD